MCPARKTDSLQTEITSLDSKIGDGRGYEE